MYAIAQVGFYDLKKDVERKAGEVFLVSQDRFDEINANGERAGMGVVLKVKEEKQPKKGKK